MSATKMLRCALSEISFSSRGFELVDWFCWKNICSTESLSGYICTQSLLQGKIENKIRHKSRTSLIQRSVFSNFEISSMERRDIATLATLNSDITPRPIVVGGLRGRVSAIVAASLCWRNICSPVGSLPLLQQVTVSLYQHLMEHIVLTSSLLQNLL